jgi:FO synthase subunit 2
MEEHITSMAGAQGGTGMGVAQLQAAITSLHRPWQQRTTLYASVMSSPLQNETFIVKS